MIPVEVTSAPWHYTTFWDWLDHWQTLIAGGVALLAALIAVQITLRVERRKADREVDALRKSLAVEFRLQIARAFDVYDGLRELGNKPDGSITARMVEGKSRMPALDAPRTATKICAMRISPVSRSMTTGTPSPA